MDDLPRITGHSQPLQPPSQQARWSSIGARQKTIAVQHPSSTSSPAPHNNHNLRGSERVKRACWCALLSLSCFLCLVSLVIGNLMLANCLNCGAADRPCESDLPSPFWFSAPDLHTWTQGQSGTELGQCRISRRQLGELDYDGDVQNPYRDYREERYLEWLRIKVERNATHLGLDL